MTHGVSHALFEVFYSRLCVHPSLTVDAELLLRRSLDVTGMKIQALSCCDSGNPPSLFQCSTKARGTEWASGAEVYVTSVWYKTIVLFENITEASTRGNSARETGRDIVKRSAYVSCVDVTYSRCNRPVIELRWKYRWIFVTDTEEEAFWDDWDVTETQTHPGSTWKMVPDIRFHQGKKNGDDDEIIPSNHTVNQVKSGNSNETTCTLSNTSVYCVLCICVHWFVLKLGQNVLMKMNVTIEKEICA